MRKLAIALGLTAAVMVAGSFAWRAEATTLSLGAVHLPTAAKNYSPGREGRVFPPRLVWTWLVSEVRPTALLVRAVLA